MESKKVFGMEIRQFVNICQIRFSQILFDLCCITRNKTFFIYILSLYLKRHLLKRNIKDTGTYFTPRCNEMR